MNVTCPSCRTTYSVGEDRIRSAQQKMRCSKCGDVFIFSTDQPEGTRPVEQTGDRRSFAEIAEQVGIPEAQDAPGAHPEKRRPGRRLRTMIVTFFILVLLAVAGYFYWANYLGSGDRWLRIGRLEGQEVLIQDGRVFLVTGVVNNGSTKGRKSIVLKVKLFDHEGKIITQKESLAGMLLSRQQIPAMTKVDIEKRIAAFKLSPAETFRVEAGREIPFSVSFLEGDVGKAKEFTVEIIQSIFL